jgi:hypothetical protein
MARKKDANKNILLIALLVVMVGFLAIIMSVTRNLETNNLAMTSKADYELDVEVMPNGTQCTKIRGCGQFCGKIAACAQQQTITCTKGSPDLSKIPALKDLKCVGGDERSITCTFDKDCREMDWAYIVMAACGCSIISPTPDLSSYPTLEPTELWRRMPSPTVPHYQ